jgi:hypothetical protein
VTILFHLTHSCVEVEAGITYPYYMCISRGFSGLLIVCRSSNIGEGDRMNTLFCECSIMFKLVEWGYVCGIYMITTHRHGIFRMHQSSAREEFFLVMSYEDRETRQLH